MFSVIARRFAHVASQYKSAFSFHSAATRRNGPPLFPKGKSVQVRDSLMKPMPLASSLCVGALAGVAKNTEKRRAAETSPSSHFAFQEFILLLGQGGYGPKREMKKNIDALGPRL